MTESHRLEAFKEQTRSEEIANSITHGVGAGLAIVALTLLVTLSFLFGDGWRIVSTGVYGLTMVFLYLASSLYHGVRAPRAKEILHRFDHAAIYLLIAGTYTPLAMVTLRGQHGWWLLGLIWVLALAGVALTFAPWRVFRRAPALLYVGMGWIGVVAVGPLWRALGAPGMFWLGAGGLLYTGGVVFYRWKSLPYNHAIWHLFVLGGSFCHFILIFGYVVVNWQW
ncbi:MAG: hemolysin III family protein [Myxococcales bacterium]|nr:hemolysin III family protein [Myxococcales bacterium]